MLSCGDTASEMVTYRLAQRTTVSPPQPTPRRPQRLHSRAALLHTALSNSPAGQCACLCSIESLRAQQTLLQCLPASLVASWALGGCVMVNQKSPRFQTPFSHSDQDGQDHAQVAMPMFMTLLLIAAHRCSSLPVAAQFGSSCLVSSRLSSPRLSSPRSRRGRQGHGLFL